MTLRLGEVAAETLERISDARPSAAKHLAITMAIMIDKADLLSRAAEERSEVVDPETFDAKVNALVQRIRGVGDVGRVAPLALRSQRSGGPACPEPPHLGQSAVRVPTDPHRPHTPDGRGTRTVTDLRSSLAVFELPRPRGSPQAAVGLHGSARVPEATSTIAVL